MVKRISRIATMLVPEGVGVDLRFINHDEIFTDLREDEINRAVNKVSLSYSGGTKLGKGLEERILKPLVYEPLDAGTLKRPLLISIITDGEPTDDPVNRFQQAILLCKQKLAKKNYPYFSTSTSWPDICPPISLSRRPTLSED